jgi:hypothetical protein
MTVMLPQFFGVPQRLVRSGLLTRLKPAQLCLYVGLLHDSERYCTRELIRSDQQLTALTGVSPRSLRDARIKLQEHGLIQYQLHPGRRCTYVICDPLTGKPYPLDPKEKILYSRKTAKAPPVSVPDQRTPDAAERAEKRTSVTSQSPDHGDLAVHGVPLSFK